MNTNNSRYLTYEEVSGIFVKTSYFEQLSKPCHSVVLGARGCGKTTLLKMLHPNAVNEYKKRDSNIDIPFYGIYIPSDRQWSIGLEQIEENSGNKDRMILSKALVNLNVLLAFLNSVKAIKDILELDEMEMINYCMSLIKYWELDSAISPALELLSIELIKYSISIKDYINNSDGNSSLPYVCRTSFWDTLVIGINMFEMHFPSYPLKKRWALCFDEMEMTPTWLQKEVMDEKLRNVNQKFLIKATGTPDWNIDSSDFGKPTTGHDYEIIKCWNKDYTSEISWKSFCNQIIERDISSDYDISTQELIDYVTFEDPLNLEALIRELCKYDKGFAEYFSKENYDINPRGDIQIKAMQTKSKRYMRAVLRARYEYYKSISRGKFSNKVYLGNFLLYNFADGNPRLFQNILGRIILTLKRNDKRKLKPNMPALESIVRSISTEAAYERLSVSTMPKIKVNGNNYLSFPELLDTIGKYFSKCLLSKEYNSSPVTMFEIARNSPFIPFINTGLENGTIIKIEDQRRYSGKSRPVYRLSYILYPYYGYVDTYSKEVELLENIISKSNSYEAE